MSFLDKNNRIIDMILTDYGKSLYSKGELEFSYYAFSDDEIDYDPYVSNSSSLSDEQLESEKIKKIHDSLICEAKTGLHKVLDVNFDDKTNINKLLYSQPQELNILSELKISPDILSASLQTNQKKISEVYVKKDSKNRTVVANGPFDLGFVKTDTTTINLECSVDNFFNENNGDGFALRVFQSSSDGLVEIEPKRDLSNVLSYSNDLIIFKDEEIENEVNRIVNGDRDNDLISGVVRDKNG